MVVGAYAVGIGPFWGEEDRLPTVDDATTTKKKGTTAETLPVCAQPKNHKDDCLHAPGFFTRDVHDTNRTHPSRGGRARGMGRYPTLATGARVCTQDDDVPRCFELAFAFAVTSF